MLEYTYIYKSINYTKQKTKKKIFLDFLSFFFQQKERKKYIN